MFTDKRADEHGGEPVEGLTPERTAELWERIQRIKSIHQLEKIREARFHECHWSVSTRVPQLQVGPRRRIGVLADVEEC